MPLTPDDLPDDVDVLKRRVIALAREHEQLLKKARLLAAFMPYGYTGPEPAPPTCRDGDGVATTDED